MDEVFGTHTTSYSYNYAGQVSQVMNPDASFAQYGYDEAGRLTGAADYGAVPAGQAAPELRSASLGYDPDGNQTSAKDWNGNTTSYSYDAAGQLTSTTQPVTSSSSVTTAAGYDAAGNQTAVTGGNGNTTWTTYNSWNQPESVTEPATAAAPGAAARTWTTSYTKDGQPASVSQPGGITQSYSYDPLGDVTGKSGTGAPAATPALSYGYDLDGRLASATAPGGTDTFGYNANGQLTSTGGPSGTASFQYNGDQLMSSRTDAAGDTSYTYDKAGRLATVADPLTGSALTYGYNADSLPATISYATGSTAGAARSYTYNGLQQLTGDTVTSAAGATIASAGYGYNANGDMTSQATTGYAGAGSTNYSYNQADQLTSATAGGTTTSFGYDADGNLTQAGATSSSYNAQDQVTSSASAAGSTSYTYTLNGALSSVTPPSGTTQNYTSNAYGQTATAPGEISYSYDALGRLATRAASAATTTLAYSGTAATLASDGTTRYSYGPGGGMVGFQRSGGPAQSALTNPHGDVTGAFSPATGTSLSASAAYSPYGTVTATSGSMPSLGYQGQYTDPATGQVDMNARWYSPATGAFTSNDTITGSPLSSTIDGNPYAYAGADPLTTTDPTGNCWLCLAPLVGLVKYGARYAAPSVELGTLAAWAPAVGAMVGWGLLLGVVGFAAASFFFPSGIQSGDCPAAGCYGQPPGGGPPILSELEPGWGAHSGIGWGPSYNPGGYPGSGPCGAYCSAPVPPPPPPPPQDCYAGPDPSCHPPTAPHALRYGQYESQQVRVTTSFRAVPPKDRIIEPAPTEQQLLNNLHTQLSGITAQDGENGTAASTQGSSENLNTTQDPAASIGTPATPQAPGAEPATPATAGAGGIGGGTPPPTALAAPEPPNPGPGKPRFIVDSNGTITDTTPAAPEAGGARFVAGPDGVTDTVGTAPNAVTLGRYPGYVRAAALDGSRTFNLGNAWEDMAARTDRFGGTGPGSEVSIRNMSFLDKAIANGSDIRLSSDPLDPANAGSAFLDEINYLQKAGYSLQGNRMVP
jgi:RHS repeat-associated protein